VTSKRFSVQEKMQLQFEIFYDPYSFYDLEVSLNSIKYEMHSVVELSDYEGAKSFLAELNPGAYEIKITQRVAGTD